MTEPGKQPDYNLHAMNKGTDEKSRAGVAWAQANGRISIKLNAFVVLHAGEDLILSLFPWNARDKEKFNKQAGHNPDGSSTPF